MFENNQIEDIRNVENERYNRFSIIIHSIRAISIFLILIFHIGSWFLNINKFSKNYFVIFGFGDIGVYLFFFLSGMLLTINTLNRSVENQSWRDWYKRRIMRIFPPYWIMLSIIIVFSFITNYYIGFTLILVNFSGFQMIPIENPNFAVIHFIYWYITAILSCYILFPLIYLAIRKKFKILTIIGITLFAIIIYFFNFFLLILLSIAKNLNLQLDEFILPYFIIIYFVFFFGIVFGYWIGKNNMQNLEKIYKIKIGISLFIILICLLFSSFIIFLFLKSYQIWMFPSITFVFIPFLLFLLNKFYKINDLLTYFGKRSYEIYLVHSFLFTIIALIFFELFSLPIILGSILTVEESYLKLISDLMVLPIFLLIVFTCAHFLNRIVDIITHQKKFYPFIIILAMSFFLFALIAIFLPFYIGFFLALFIFTSILIFLFLIYKKRSANLTKSPNLQLNQAEKDTIDKKEL